MNKKTALNISDLLPDELVSLDEVIKQEIRGKLTSARRLPGYGWRVVRSKANRALREILNFNVLQVFGRAWSHASELREFTDQARYPAGREWTVALSGHELKTSIYPELEITCGDVLVATPRFDLELTAEFRSAVLAVRGGRITAISAGDCEVAAALSFGDFSFPGVKSGEIEFTDRYEFQPPGLAIGS